MGVARQAAQEEMAAREAAAADQHESIKSALSSVPVAIAGKATVADFSGAGFDGVRVRAPHGARVRRLDARGRTDGPDNGGPWSGNGSYARSFRVRNTVAT